MQAATIVPTFLLALPAGALADIVDRRRYLICDTRPGPCAAATSCSPCPDLRRGFIDASLASIALTFAIGIGSAMYQPAWGATVPEIVPRADLVQAIALNGIGFNLARAVGPALGGILVLVRRPGSLAFLLYAVSFVGRHCRADPSGAGPDHPRPACRASTSSGRDARRHAQFVRHTPAMQGAMIRAVAYFLPSAAIWALLPLVVREQLGLGAGSFGILLGLMGVGGVTSGMLLPRLRGLAGRGARPCSASSLFSGAGMGAGRRHPPLGARPHWA